MDSPNKKLFIGVDEAGYGPNLGPLTIAASIWEANSALTEEEFAEALGKVFQPKPWTADCTHIPLGDSKQLYQSGSGLHSLEAGLLALLLQTDQAQELTPNIELPHDIAQLLSHTHASQSVQTPTAPWYEHLESLAVPVDIDVDQVLRLSQIAREHLAELGIRCIGLRARIVPESMFNDLVDKLDSKGLVLSQLTLSLVAETVGDHSAACEIFCDRQGGRKNYLPVLSDAFPDYWFHEIRVSNERCSYQNAQPKIDIHFSVGGDSFPPTALASMLAKYLRERIMESFNSFWQEQVPGMKPTAGYPQDAKRFRADAADAIKKSKLAERNWWRCR